MKKRIISLLVCIVMTFFACPTVFADVLWTPPDDFLSSHPMECKANVRDYLSNGKAGYISVNKDPESTKIVGNIKNGFQLHVSMTYIDKKNINWGVVQYYIDKDKKPTQYEEGKDYEAIVGWVKMSDLKLVYDYISFEEEHKAEIKDYKETFDETKYQGNLIMWDYPNSPNHENTFPLDEIKQSPNKLTFEKSYTDKNGIQWGFVPYYYGSKHFWVNLSEPADNSTAVISSTPSKEESEISDSSTAVEPTIGVIPPAGESHIPKVKNNLNAETILLIILVAGVVIITAILIAVFFKKRGNDDKKE